MSQKKDEGTILFDLGRGKRREATEREIELGILPPSVESVIYRDSDGSETRRYNDGMGR